MQFRHVLLAILVVAAWGIHAPIIRFGLGEIPPFFMAGMRFFGVALLFLPFAKFNKKDLKNIVIFAIFFNFMHLPSVFSALKYLNASSFIVILQMVVPFTAIWGLIFHKEKIGIRTASGILISMLGMLIVFGTPQINMLGLFFTSIGIFSACVQTFHMKKMGGINLPALIGIGGLLAFLPMFVISYFTEQQLWQNLNHIDYKSFSFVWLYQVLIMSAAMMIWQRVLEHNPVNLVVPFSLLQPIFGVLGGALWLGEEISSQLLFGGAVVMAGVAVVTVRRAQKSKQEPTPQEGELQCQ